MHDHPSSKGEAVLEQRFIDLKVYAIFISHLPCCKYTWLLGSNVSR